MHTVLAVLCQEIKLAHSHAKDGKPIPKGNIMSQRHVNL